VSVFQRVRCCSLTKNQSISKISILRVQPLLFLHILGVREWISEGPLDGTKITTLFSLTSNRNLACHAIVNVGNKVIYGL